MDVDWCLSCERKLDDMPGPYCSPQCLSYAEPASAARLAARPPSDAFRIREWARAIPPHIPAGAPPLPFADLPDPLPSERPPSPRARLPPTPKLIERTAASTPLPTLCVSSPAHVRPPHPACNPYHACARPANPTCMSEASTSLSSLLTEPMVATPDEDASFGANIGAFVRSWVHCDCASAKSKDVCVIEKVTDYFPPMPLGKKTFSPPSSSKKPTKSPTHVPRQKPSPSKAQRRDRTHSHTPTPVIFPSCRAAELNWVDGDDDDDDAVLAPRPQYHPTYYHKYELERPLARAPSSSSLSSSASSVLLMAPVRGRKGARAIAT